MTRRRFLVGISPMLWAAAVLLLSPALVIAHGVGYHREADQRAIVLKFEYSTGEPMTYAETLVFAPDDLNLEYQNGRTDRQGRFAFHPDKMGAWQVIVSDGQGHRVKAQLEVTATGISEAQRPSGSQTGMAGASLWLKAVLGLSCFANIGLLAVVLRNKKTVNPLKG